MELDLLVQIQHERDVAQRKAFEAGCKLASLVGEFGALGSEPVDRVAEVMKFLIPDPTDQS